MNVADHEKQVAARRSIEFVQPGMLVGLGSGSTAAHAIRLLGERVRQGLSIQGIATSEQSARLAEASGISVLPFDRDPTTIDLTIDGADEIAPGMQLIKGGGGALLHEKIVAAASRKLVIVADSTKLVVRLGAFPLPVEVIRFGWPSVAERLHRLGANPTLRLGPDGQPFLSDEGNLIVDCRFSILPEPELLATQLDAITGVVEHGLFLDFADMIVIGRGEQTELLGSLN